MAKRKKRLQKGIDSLEKQIEFHEEKKKLARELGQEELFRYYTKEIEALKKVREDKERKRDR
jgi:hypothetical protein